MVAGIHNFHNKFLEGSLISAGDVSFSTQNSLCLEASATLSRTDSILPDWDFKLQGFFGLVWFGLF